jgi:hypothetical protein
MISTLFHSTLGSIGSMPPVMWVMLVPISVFIVGGVVAILAIAMKNQERERWHETARIALAKGLPVPGMPDPRAPQDARPGRHRQRMGLITGGLVNVAVGIGLYYGLSEIPGAWVARDFAFIPALCGVALLLGAAIDLLLSRKFPDPGDNSPKS